MWTNLERFSNISNILTASRPINIKAGIIFDPSGKQGTPLVLHSPTCSSQDSTIEVTIVYYYYSKSIQCWVPCCLLIILILGHPSLFFWWRERRKNSEQFVLQSPPPAWFPNHSIHTQLFHNCITYVSVSSSHQKITFALSVWEFFVGNECWV